MEIDMRNIKWLLATGLIAATTAGCVETTGYPTTAYNNGYPAASYNNGYPVAAYNNNYPAAVANNGYYNNGAYNNGAAYRNAQTNTTPADRSDRRYDDRDANGDGDRDRR
jgi:hypothetical protein